MTFYWRGNSPIPEPTIGPIIPPQELTRRRVVYLVSAMAGCLLLNAAVAAAQAAWEWPGLALPASDGLVLVLAALVFVVRRGQRRPRPVPGLLPHGCATGVLMYLLGILFLPLLGLSTPYGQQHTDDLAPTVRRGECWQANALVRRPLRRGDIVAIGGRRERADRAVQVVGLPGDVLIWEGGRLQHARALVGPHHQLMLPGPGFRVPQGQVAVAGYYPWILSPLVPLDEIRGRVVVVTWPLWRVRSL